MSEYLHKSHNVSVLIYHLVCPAKNRRVVFDKTVDTVLKEICLEIAKRYELVFLEIGTDKDHVHFLIQSVQRIAPPRLSRSSKVLPPEKSFTVCQQSKSNYGAANCGPKGTLSVPLVGTAMKKPFASMSRSRDKNRPISNCIVKTSSCSCSDVLGLIPRSLLRGSSSVLRKLQHDVFVLQAHQEYARCHRG